jgi:hypothetical protein
MWMYSPSIPTVGGNGSRSETVASVHDHLGDDVDSVSHGPAQQKRVSSTQRRDGLQVTGQMTRRLTQQPLNDSKHSSGDSWPNGIWTLNIVWVRLFHRPACMTSTRTFSTARFRGIRFSCPTPQSLTSGWAPCVPSGQLGGHPTFKTVAGTVCLEISDFTPSYMFRRRLTL